MGYARASAAVAAFGLVVTAAWSAMGGFAAASGTGYVLPEVGTAVAAPSGSSSLAYSAGDGLLATVSPSADTVALFKLGSGVINPTPRNTATAGAPDSVAFSPNGQDVAVAETGGIEVFAYTASTGALTPVSGSPFSTGYTAPLSPGQIAYSPDGTMLAMTNSSDDSVAIYSVSSSGQLTPLNGSPFAMAGPGFTTTAASTSALAWSPDSGQLATVNAGSASVAVFLLLDNGGTETAESSNGSPFSTGGTPSGVAFDPTGSLVATADANPDTVSEFSDGTGGDTGSLTALGSPVTVGGSRPVALSYSAGGHLLLTADEGSSTLHGFSVAADGTLAPVATASTGSGTGAAPSALTFLAPGQVAEVNQGSSTAGTLEIFSTAPTATTSTPAAGASYGINAHVPAAYACSGPLPVTSCSGTVANGANIDTSTLGTHAFSVKATDSDGVSTTMTTGYTVAAAGTATTSTTPGTPTTGPGSPAPVAPGSAPLVPTTAPLSATTCTDTTRAVSTGRGTLWLTGCLLSDNRGHYVADGPALLNGVLLLPESATGGSGHAVAPFDCLANAICSSLRTRYDTSKTAMVAVDTQGLALASNAKYLVKAGSAEVGSGLLGSAGAPVMIHSALAPPVGTGDPSFGGAIAAGAAFHGFGLSGAYSVDLLPGGGADVTVNSALPQPIGDGLTIDYTLDQHGNEVAHSESATALNVGLFGKTFAFFDPLSFSYDSSTDTWTATATVGAPQFTVPKLYHQKPSDPDAGLLGAVKGQLKSVTKYASFVTFPITLSVQDGHFKSIAGGADGLNIPVAEGVFLNSIGANVGFNPLTFGATIGLGGGPPVPVLGGYLLEFEGALQIGIDAPFTQAPIDYIAPAGLYYPKVPFSLSITGDATIDGKVPLAGLRANLLVGGGANLLDLEAGLGVGGNGFAFQTASGTTLAYVNAQVAGLVQPGAGFDAVAIGKAVILGTGVDLEGVLSNTGIAACARIGGQVQTPARAANAKADTSRLNSLAPAIEADPLASAVSDRIPLNRIARLSGPVRARQLTLLLSDARHEDGRGQAIVVATRRRAAELVRQYRRRIRVFAARTSGALTEVNRGYRARRTSLGLTQLRAFAASGRFSAQTRSLGITLRTELMSLRQQAANQESQVLARVEHDGDEYSALRGGLTYTQGQLTARVASRAVIAEGFFSGLGNAFTSLKSDVVKISSSIVTTVKAAVSAEKSAVVSILSADKTAVTTLKHAAAGALDDLTSSVKTGLGDLSDAEQTAKQWAASAAVSVQNGLSVATYWVQDHVPHIQLGFGYDWGGSAHLLTAGGCDLGPYVTKAVSDASAVPAPQTVHLPANPGYSVIAVTGVNGLPDIDVSGPGHVDTTTPSDGQPHQEGNAVVIPDASSNTVFVEVMTGDKPGDYRVVPQPGSVPLSAVSTDGQLPAPQVSAHVTGSGIHRTLHWKATPEPGQTLSFTTASDASAGDTTIVTASNRASGSQPFIAPYGPAGNSAVTVNVMEDGFSVAQSQVAEFTTPILPAPGVPGALKLTRIPGGVSVSWRPSATGASQSYRVTATTASGQQQSTSTYASAVAFENIPSTETVHVEVVPVDYDGGSGAAASQTLAPVGSTACYAPNRLKVDFKLPLLRSIARGSISINGIAVGNLPKGATSVTLQSDQFATPSPVISVSAFTSSGRALTGRATYGTCSQRSDLKITLSL